MIKLQNPHKQLTHPSATQLHDQLKTTGTKSVSPKTIEKLGYLVSTYEPVKKTGTAPKRYCVTIGTEKTRLYVKVYIDFSYIERVQI